MQPLQQTTLHLGRDPQPQSSLLLLRLSQRMTTLHRYQQLQLTMRCAACARRGEAPQGGSSFAFSAATEEARHTIEASHPKLLQLTHIHALIPPLLVSFCRSSSPFRLHTYRPLRNRMAESEAFGASGPFAAADGFYSSSGFAGASVSHTPLAAAYLRPSHAAGAGAYSGSAAFGAGAGASIEDYENEPPLLEGACRCNRTQLSLSFCLSTSSPSRRFSRARR